MANNPGDKKKPTPPNDPQPAPEPNEDDILAELLGDDAAVLDQPPSGNPESEVDLGRASGGRPPQPPSGQSSTIWADMVKEPSSTGNAGPADFDAPSDAEAIEHARGEQAEDAEPIDSGSDILGHSPAMPGAESSRVDLFDPPPASDPLQSEAHPPHAGRVEDVSGLSAHSGLAPGLSDVSLHGDASNPTPEQVAGAYPLDSSINLGSDPLVEVKPAPRPGPSGIDFADATAESEEKVDARESGIDLGSAAVVDVDQPSAPLSAAVAESGFDIGSPAVEEVDEPAPRIESGIDLGSAAVVEIFQEDTAGVLLPDSGVDLGAAAQASDPSMEGGVLIDSSSGMGLEGAVMIEDDEAETELLHGEKMLEPSSDSDILIGADDSSAVLGSGMLLESPSSEQLAGASAEEVPEMEFLDLGEAASPEPSESTVNLDAIGEERGSSRDLIAEAVESGVDLAGTAEDGDEAIVLTGDEAAGESSSKVDLGAAIVMEDEPPAGGLSPDDLALELFKEPEAEEAKIAEEEDLAGAAVIDDDEHVDTSLETAPEGAEVTADGADEGKLPEESEEAKTEEEAADFLSELGDQAEGEATEEGLTLAEGEEEAGEAVEEKSDEEDEEERRPPARPRYGRRWVGGTLVGMTLATAACVAVITFQPDLAGEIGGKLRGLIDYPDSDTPGEPGKKIAGGKKQSGGGEQAATIRDVLKRAEFDKDPPAIDEDSGEDRAARGEFLWKKYLSKTQPPFKPDAPEVVKALADLKAAGEKPAAAEGAVAAAADALYWQGHIHEMANNRDEAKKIYEAASGRFNANAELKQRFDDAIERLDVLQPVKAPAPMPPGPGARLPVEVFPIGLDWLAGQAKTPPEAGPDFWKALKAAADLKFAGDDGAIKKLTESLKKHRERRLTQIGKPQNPYSDTAEEIFIKAGEQILAYWALQEKIKGYEGPGKAKYLAADKPDAVKAVDTLLADFSKETMALKTAKEDYKTLDTAKKEADKKITDLMTMLAAEEKLKKDALAKLKTTEDALKAETAKVAAAEDKVKARDVQITRLGEDKKKLEETIIGTGDKIGLRDIDPVRSKPILYQKLDDLVNVASTKDPQGRIAANIVEIRTLNATLEQRWTPEAMLGFWTPLLADRTQREFAGSALKDAERVKTKATAPLADRSHAYAVEGLALRNQGNYVKAKMALEEAIRGDVAGPAWKPAAKDVLKELTDPAAWFLPRSEDLRARRRYDEALAMLDEGMKVFPEKTGELLALRSQVRLEKALGIEGKLTQDTPGVKESLEDAEAAIKAGAEGPGNFAAARLAEELAQRQLAEQLYRKVMAAVPENHPDASKARLAISKLLLFGIEPKPAPEPMPKTSRGPAGLPRRIGGMLLPDFGALVMGQLPSPEEEAKIKEALRLADEVLKRPDIDQLPLLKARALAVKGMWTQALNTYVEGLKPHLSREHLDGLKYLVENHPLQRRPDVARVPHPMQAERHYAQGLTRFYTREYQAAEKEFSKAIENFEQDARYHYFLGLSRLAQGRLTAKEDFEQGAKLEIDNRPAPAAVNAALERIQGEPRRLIREARDRIR